MVVNFFLEKSVMHPICRTKGLKLTDNSFVLVLFKPNFRATQRLKRLTDKMLIKCL